ncbi:hypothetical protein MZG86_17760 [Escherichia coli]|nr:hypothetical protein [Escherichia coli]MCK3695141.1 hypothetical protein [Escherichia coli]
MKALSGAFLLSV